MIVREDIRIDKISDSLYLDLAAAYGIDGFLIDPLSILKTGNDHGIGVFPVLMFPQDLDLIPAKEVLNDLVGHVPLACQSQ